MALQMVLLESLKLGGGRGAKLVDPWIDPVKAGWALGVPATIRNFYVGGRAVLSGTYPTLSLEMVGPAIAGLASAGLLIYPELRDSRKTKSA